MGSIFDILGPVMVGPSSSHTAGAVRIGLVARQLFGCQPDRAFVYLHGSFASTGKGHGTDKALIAGILGMTPDDMRIPRSFQIAREQGMEFHIANKNMKEAHPNTAEIILEKTSKKSMRLQACSIGGGRIRVSMLDDVKVNFSGENYTVIIKNVDEPGKIMDVSAILSAHNINVGTMSVIRDRRGGNATMIVETDERVSSVMLDELKHHAGIIDVRYLDPKSM